MLRSHYRLRCPDLGVGILLGRVKGNSQWVCCCPEPYEPVSCLASFFDDEENSRKSVILGLGFLGFLVGFVGRDEMTDSQLWTSDCVSSTAIGLGLGLGLGHSWTLMYY